MSSAWKSLNAHRRDRARLNRLIRRFFDAREVLEVETPIASAFGNPDANIESASLDSDRGYLRTSPEFFHKRLLADDVGPIYELGRVFRQGERGQWHSPEFTMLEWYLPGVDAGQLATQVVELIGAVGTEFGRRPVTVRRIDFPALFSELTGGLNFFDHDRNKFRTAIAIECGVSAASNLDWREAVDLAMGLKMPALCGDDQVLVIENFPREMAALAEIDANDSSLANRFEVYVSGIEMANGYQELRDGDELADRLDNENRARRMSGRREVPIDPGLIEAHHQGLPACSGVALGVDRLLAWAVGAKALACVLEFAEERIC